MSNKIFKVFVDKMGGHKAEDYIGLPGDLFYDPNTGVLKLSDGETVGGVSHTETSPLESLYKGDWVYFVRPDDEPDVVDKISDNLWITRNPINEGWGSLYNSALDGDTPYDPNGSVNTPAGTEWNIDGWDDFSNIFDRSYQNFTNMPAGGWANVKYEYIMHDTFNDKYYAVRFLTWDSGSNGATGAFGYIRREINTDIYFKRADTNDEGEALSNGDEVSSGLYITRGSGGAIFNYAEGLVGNWTQFVLADIGETATWVDNTISFNMPESGTLISALEFLKAGDYIFLDYTGNGDGSGVTLTSAYNPVTHSFTVDWAPNPPGVSINPQFIWMNVPVLAHLETDWNDNQSPKNTLWNAEGYDDLSNLFDRQFVLFADLWGSNELGQRICGKELIMHDTVADTYYAIKFTRWSQGWMAGGADYPGFSYTRRQIDTSKLSSGLKFNDGSVQNTGYTYKKAAVIKKADTAYHLNDRYLTADDIGKMIYIDSESSTHIRIPDAIENFPVGGTVTIVNRSGSDVFVSKVNDNEGGTIYGAGTGNYATSWIIPDTGGGNIAVLMKIESQLGMGYYTNWMLSGSGIQVD